MSVALQLAGEAEDFITSELPSDVIHRTKRLLLDTLGCAIGAFGSDTYRVMRKCRSLFKSLKNT